MSSITDNTFKMGTVLNDKWVILEFLGRGGMGEVYRAHQLNLNRDVAIKIVSTKWFEEIADNEYEAETCLERFRQEVQVMAQVRHPNVLQVFDYGFLKVKKGGEDATIEFIAMEYIPGGSLRSTMSPEGFYPEEGRMKEWLSSYFLPVLDGMEALHALGIVHRDLKPENILLDGKIPKIADFGLARSCRLKPITQSMDIKGTPPYMPPEQFLDLKRTDQRSDIYSLGKILYEAASGKMTPDEFPFRQASLKDAETPFFKGLDEIIRGATAEDKKARFPSVEVLKPAIAKLLDEDGKIALGPKDAALEKIRNRKTQFLIVGIAAFLIGFIGFWTHTHNRSPIPSPANQFRGQEPHSQESGVSPDRARTALPQEIMGQDHTTLHLIPAGEISLPKNLTPDDGKPLRVNTFYMDETPVTNQEYVEFLNKNISRIKVGGGVVQGDGEIWLLLGEVMEGYEPIIFQDGTFYVHNPQHAACPVLRVTGYGATAYALFFGKQLPTEEEWLFAVEKGSRAPGEFGNAAERSSEVNANTKHGMMHTQTRSQAPSPPSVPKAGLPIPYPVILSGQNALGIRGLNENIGEWGIKIPTDGASKGKIQEYVVLGGALKNPEHRQGAAPAVQRQPWESFAEVSFRCALSVTK
jgi:serine/threonine-protein kinase